MRHARCSLSRRWLRWMRTVCADMGSSTLLARRPWVHQKEYVRIDRLLAELVPRYFRHRKLESEFATLFLPPPPPAAPPPQ